tara:strand:+ start:60 stop:1334 length:1275 start_codon:yes stop_codon:yes gene_type:complete
MGGGILQLSSYGGQDIETVGNPQISFFKSVYKKHTNFAIETIEQQFEGNISNKESKVYAKINKNGDLIHKCYLDIKFPKFPSSSGPSTYNNWTNGTAYAYVKEVSLLIGDLLIDKHISEWFDVWNELTDYYQNEHLMVNKHLSKIGHLKRNQGECEPLQCYLPLQFWFNRYTNLALPLVALQFHDVKLQFVFRDLDNLINTDGSNVGTNTTPPNTKLFVDFIFLDVDERKKFAQNSHEYLIEQVQFNKTSLNKRNEIKFNHTVKEIIWVCRNNNVGKEATSNIDATLNKVNSALSNGNDYFNYSTLTNTNVEYVGGYPSNEPFSHATINFNGINRFDKQRASYFRTVQPINYHTRVPTKHIYCYSFALQPQKHQPSGTCNFSRMHTAFLELDNITTDPSELLVFATNYNVLVIQSGMAGLKYSN